ncbi:unnamed protein product [Victoria cruziana]
MTSQPPAASVWDGIDARINRLFAELDSLNRQILDYNLRLGELADRLQRLVWPEPPSIDSEIENSSSGDGDIAEEHAIDTYYAYVQGKKMLSEIEVSKRLKEMETVSHVVACNEQEEWKCTVCMEGWEVDGRGGDEVKLLSCSHMYHTNCIAEWLAYKNLCPLCRSSVY